MSNETLVRQILVEIDRDPSISQRQLSDNLGVSIGIVNWHMKRFVGKGLVKLQKAPVRRYLYYLTPSGFAEKARLTAEYLNASFDIFRQGAPSIRGAVRHLQRKWLGRTSFFLATASSWSLPAWPSREPTG